MKNKSFHLPFFKINLESRIDRLKRIGKFKANYCQVGRHWTAGQHCTVITFSITAMLQVVCVLDRSLKVSAPHSRKFLNVPTTFELLFYCQNNNFQTKKTDVLRRSFDWKLISPNVFRDVQITVRFVHHVSDCYCSGRRNLNKFF